MTRRGTGWPPAGAPPRRVSSPPTFCSALRRAVAEELSPRQREVFVAVALNEVEIDAVAERLQSTRGAVYKVLHDARRKLRLRLEREGHLEPVETR